MAEVQQEKQRLWAVSTEVPCKAEDAVIAYDRTWTMPAKNTAAWHWLADQSQGTEAECVAIIAAKIAENPTPTHTLSANASASIEARLGIYKIPVPCKAEFNALVERLSAGDYSGTIVQPETPEQQQLLSASSQNWTSLRT